MTALVCPSCGGTWNESKHCVYCRKDWFECAECKDLKTRIEELTLALRVATCTCSPRHASDPVPLDNVASHHDFSCGFRQAMQPVLRGASP